MSAYDPKRTSPSSSTPGLSRYNAVSSGLEGAMTRRDFITLIGTVRRRGRLPRMRSSGRCRWSMSFPQQRQRPTLIA